MPTPNKDFAMPPPVDRIIPNCRTNHDCLLTQFWEWSYQLVAHHIVCCLMNIIIVWYSVSSHILLAHPICSHRDRPMKSSATCKISKSQYLRKKTGPLKRQSGWAVGNVGYEFHGARQNVKMVSKHMGVSENVVYPFLPNGFADHYPY